MKTCGVELFSEQVVKGVTADTARSALSAALVGLQYNEVGQCAGESRCFGLTYRDHGTSHVPVPDCIVFCIVWPTPSRLPHNEIPSILMIFNSCNASLSGVSSTLTSKMI